MPTIKPAAAPTATRGALTKAHAVIVTAALAGFAALTWLTSPYAATPPARSAATQPSPQPAALPVARPGAATAAGTTVPAASAVFAQGSAAVEVAAPSF